MNTIILLFITFVVVKAQESTFECKFVEFHSKVLSKNIRKCFATFSNITAKDTIVALSSQSSSTDLVEIEGFEVRNQSHVQYVPKGIEEIFPNLIYLDFDLSGLKELHQSDLSPFGMLREITFYGNSIEYLEKDLFKLNPALVKISLDKNKIAYIHPNVFDHLTSLKYLFLEDNVCINAKNWEIKDFAEIVSKSKAQCSDPLNLLQKLAESLKGDNISKQRITTLTYTIKILKSSEEGSKNLISNLQNEKKVIEKEIESLKVKSTLLEGNKTSMENRLATLQNENEILKNKTNALEASLNATLEDTANIENSQFESHTDNENKLKKVLLIIIPSFVALTLIVSVFLFFCYQCSTSSEA